MVRKKNIILYIFLGIIGLAALLGIPYYVVLNNHEFYLNTDQLTLGDGKDYQIDLIPKDKSEFDINDYIFESENPNIAEVSEEGKVTTKNQGTTTIKVKYKYSPFSKKIKINVTDEIIEAEKVILNKSKVTIAIDESITLEATVKPDNTTEKSLTWKSNNENVATVDDSGEVTGIGKGTAIISVETVNHKTAKVAVFVKGEEKAKVSVIEAKSVSLNSLKTRISIGDQYQLKATVYPSTATDKSITWSSNDNSIATVDNNGLVTAIAEGKTKINATTTNYKRAIFEVTVSSEKIEVTGISLDKKNEIIKIGEELQLNEIITPSNATNQNVTWTSSNNSVATVNSSGLVTAKKTGTTIITATTSNGRKATCRIYVKNAIIDVTEIALDKSEEAINVGESTQLSETITPSNATNQNVTWTSSNNSVATVSNTGLVTGKTAGTTTITVKTSNGKTTTCVITVNAVEATEIVLNKTTDGILVGKTSQLSAKVGPSNATNKTVTWSSSDDTVVTVSSNGLVTGKKEGTATITAKTYNNISETCYVTVSKGTIAVTSININQPETTIKINGTIQLSTTITPNDATNQTVTWSSSNSNIASISKTGLVIGKKAGTVTITAKTSNGKSSSVKINVAKLSDTVTIVAKTTTYTGNAVVPTTKSLSGSNVTINYYNNQNCTTKVDVPKNAGTYYAIATSAGNGTYNSGTSDCTKAVIINKKNDTIKISLKNVTYTGSVIIPTVKAYSGSKTTLSYYSDYNCKKTSTTPRNVGTYYATASSEGNINYNSGTSACTKAVVINKKNDIVTIATKTAEYTGNTIATTVNATSETDITITYYSNSSCSKKITTPKNIGTYYAIAKSAGNNNYIGGTSGCVKAVVIKKPAIKSITLNKKSLELNEGKTATLTANIVPEISSNDKLTWISDNESVAKVAKNGKITAISEGNATITVTTSNNKTASCIVKVSKVAIPVASISLSNTSVTTSIDNSVTLSATVKPTTATNKNITWKTSNKKIATVDKNGKITPKRTGTVKITATASNGTTATATITIKGNKIHFLKAVSRDYILLESNGKFALVDTGVPESYKRIKEYLDKFGINKLEFILITHNHYDHIGSAAELIKDSNLSVSKIYLKEYPIYKDTNIPTNINDSARTNYINNRERFKETISAAKSKNIGIVYIDKKTDGYTITLGDMKYSQYNTKVFTDSKGNKGFDENRNSLIGLLKVNNYNVLLTGDFVLTDEWKNLMNGPFKNLKIDVLKIAHHGYHNCVGDKYDGPAIMASNYIVTNDINSTIVGYAQNPNSNAYQCFYYIGKSQLSYADKKNETKIKNKGKEIMCSSYFTGSTDEAIVVDLTSSKVSITGLDINKNKENSRCK